MKTIKLAHGTARVSENITKETKSALNKMAELAKTHYTKKLNLHGVVNINFLNK